MIIPTYWAKGTYKGQDAEGNELTLQAWGWSRDSQAAALELGTARARRAGERLASGKRRDSYDYLDCPLHEEIVRTISCAGEETAVITRNRYGALVLNAAAVCFIDVDFPPPRAHGFLDALKLLFSASWRQARAKAQQEETLQGVRQWSQANPKHSFRLYRTAAGLRLLFTDGLYDPTSATVHDLLEGLGSDPLYRRLTLKQQCFRARLTPKPWRCGCAYPPHQYPWQKPADEAAFRHWQQAYEEKSKSFGTCRLVESLGLLRTWEGPVAAVVTAHDELACGAPERPLA